MNEDNPNKDTGYACSQCGLPVTPINGVLVRSCVHSDATVVTTMEAQLFGEGGADNGA